MEITEEITVKLDNKEIRDIIATHLNHLGKVDYISFDQKFDSDASIWPDVKGMTIKLSKNK